MRGHRCARACLPFVIALGFATAAVTVLLVDRFGAIAACSMVAAAFTLVGLLAIFTVQATEHQHEVVEQAAVVEAKREVVSGATSEAVSQVPLALLATLLSAAGGPTSTMGVARLVGRNLPLVALAVVIGALLLPETVGEEPAADKDIPNTLNGSIPLPTASIQPSA